MIQANWSRLTDALCTLVIKNERFRIKEKRWAKDWDLYTNAHAIYLQKIHTLWAQYLLSNYQHKY